METELKLLLPADWAPRLREHPLLLANATATPQTRNYQDRYFDTPQRDFLRCGAGLRVRAVDGKFLQTLKAGGTVEGALHQRHEWEAGLASALPELAILREQVGHASPWSRLLRLPAAESALAPVFGVDMQRTSILLQLPQGAVIDCAIDVGQLRCGALSEPLCEVELELQAGAAVDLFDFALALLADVPLRIGALSKAERGYALAGAHAAGPVKARPLALRKRRSAEQAFGAIAANCLQQVQANAHGVGRPGEPEFVHQMRVGLRRLRSALKIHRGLLQLPAGLAAELDWLVEQLAPARDLDVLVQSTLPSALHGMRAVVDVKALCDAAQAQADAARAAAAAAIGSERYTRLMLQLARWVHGRGWRDEQVAGVAARLALPVTMLARRVLRSAHARLARRARKLKGGSADDQHRVRIAAKQLRYACEFYSSLYRRKRIKPYIAALADLQDELGAANDAAVAQRLLAQLPMAQGEAQALADRVGDWLARHGGRRQRSVRRAWKELAARRHPA